ncbi:hypothetical protein BH10PSE1_BH10PSE1_17570 [soil metagenome]
MTRSTLLSFVVLPLLAGCAATPTATSPGPILASYFDCVRERGVAISAHRGQSADDQPENSIAAITATGRAIPGAIVEIDAVLTRDSRLVLMHDDTMERTTTGHGKVADLTLAEIKAARLRASNRTLTEAAPPTLAEALEAARSVGAIASIDLKPASEEATMVLARAVVDEVRRVGAQGRVILITYTPETARAVAALAPEMMISAGAKSMSNLQGLNPAQILGWTGAGQPDPTQWAALKGRGIEAQFGTLGSPSRSLDGVYAADGDVSEYRTLYEQGVTVIATDTPLAVKDVLGAEVAAAATCRR